MEPLDVVAVEERVDDELPVEAALDVHRPERGVASETEAVQLVGEGAEVSCDVDRRPRGRDGPDEAGAFLDGHGNEVAVTFAWEPLGVRNVDESSIQAVGPAVVAADESLLVSTRRVGEAGAAVTAHVEERPEGAVAPARDHERNAERIVRDEVAGRGELGGVRDDDRQVAKEGDPFGVEASRRAVGVDVYPRLVSAASVVDPDSQTA